MSVTKKEVEEVVVREEITISGKTYEFFLDWLRGTQIGVNKTKLLNILDKDKRTVPLEELHELTKMSLPLISYHINGNLKSDGLVELELIKKEDIGKGRVGVFITDLGRELLSLINEPEKPKIDIGGRL